jgi:hypothetical protein
MIISLIAGRLQNLPLSICIALLLASNDHITATRHVHTSTLYGDIISMGIHSRAALR